MIEVVELPTGYRWHFICGSPTAPRVLMQGTTDHPSDKAAWKEAAAVRARLWAIADAVDHRQARAF